MPDQAHQKRSVSADWILNRVQNGKRVRLKNAVIKGDLDTYKLVLPTEHVDRTESQLQQRLLSECKIIFSSIEITNSEFKGTVILSNCIFKQTISFTRTSFSEDAGFYGAIFTKNARFDEAIFTKNARFDEAIFSEDARFDEAIFSTSSSFCGASFIGDAWFVQASFSRYVWFLRTTFNAFALFEGASFNAFVWFEGTSFNEYVWFEGTSFSGDILTFKDAYFADTYSQEYACRKAKNLLEKNGDREEAGYHFYREMEAKRKQKESNYRYIDYESLLFYNETNITPTELKDLFKYLRYNIFEYLFIQAIFGYGVHPLRLWGFWMGFAALFAILYWIGGGINNSTPNQPLNLLDYLWFSITVAVTPGFAGYKPATGIYQVLAGLEAIFGTFMWAAFITTFARKYMRG